MQLSELIDHCRQNKREAQKAFFELFSARMFIVCRRYMKNDESAEEALMNGFLKSYQGMKKFSYQNEAMTVAWLKKIMVNECLMQLRTQHSFLQVAELSNEVVSNDALSKLDREEIYRLILKLPLGYRTVFNLHALENYSHAEIGEMLQISEGTSKSQFHKARKQMQEMICSQNSYYAFSESK